MLQFTNLYNGDTVNAKRGNEYKALKQCLVHIKHNNYLIYGYSEI